MVVEVEFRCLLVEVEAAEENLYEWVPPPAAVLEVAAGCQWRDLKMVVVVEAEFRRPFVIELLGLSSRVRVEKKRRNVGEEYK